MAKNASITLGGHFIASQLQSSRDGPASEENYSALRLLETQNPALN